MQQAEGAAVTNADYKIALQACAMGGQWRQCMRWMEELMATSRTLIGGDYHETLAYFNTTITACDKAAQWEATLAMLDELRRRQVDPDAFTFDATIRACER